MSYIQRKRKHVAGCASLEQQWVREESIRLGQRETNFPQTCNGHIGAGMMVSLVIKHVSNTCQLYL